MLVLKAWIVGRGSWMYGKPVRQACPQMPKHNKDNGHTAENTQATDGSA